MMNVSNPLNPHLYHCFALVSPNIDRTLAEEILNLKSFTSWLKKCRFNCIHKKGISCSQYARLQYIANHKDVLASTVQSLPQSL